VGRRLDNPVSGVRALASRLGVSHAAVAKNWLKHAEWPFSRTGPWDPGEIERMKAWAARTLSPDRAVEGAGGDGGGEQMFGGQKLPTKNVAQTLESLKRVKKLDITNKILEEKYHDADRCKKRRQMQNEDLKRRMLSIPDSLPFEPEDRELVRKKITAALFALAGGFAGKETRWVVSAATQSPPNEPAWLFAAPPDPAIWDPDDLAGFEPPEDLLPSEWAEKYRVMKRGSVAPGALVR
jgi:hypothetical protein